MTQEEALRWALPGAEEIVAQEHELEPRRKKEVERKVGWQLKDTRFTFYEGRSNGKVVGYAFIDHEIGKHQPITFVVALDTEGKVRDVDVMIYRESIGGEIKGRRFLDQFHGRDASSPLKLGKDVDSITGATLSARATTRAVRKAIVLFDVFYGKVME